MEPVAEYFEQLLQVRRHFVLYRDRVVVHAHWRVKGDFESVVRLDTLTGQHRELQIRYRLFRYAGWILAIGLLVFAMCFYHAKGGPVGTLGSVALLVAIVGGGLMAMTYPNRKLFFVRFDAKSGRGGLDICQAGNKLETLKSFVDKVKRQINKHEKGS